MRHCARITVLSALCAGPVAGGAVLAGPFVKGPYLQNLTPRSVTVMWEAERPAPAVVTLLVRPPRRIEVPAEEIAETVIEGLAPGTRYGYAVELAGQRVVGEFATAPEPTSPYRFIVFGDSRSNPSSHRRVVERIRGEVPDFLLGTGDMVNDGLSDQDWQQFFDIEGELLRDNVMFPSLGNHDRQGKGRTADNYRKYFSLPENSPDPERYYAFTYGNARFLVLDSNAYSFALTDQTAWIEQQLQAARLDDSIRHVFVSMHHPPFSISLHGGRTELRDAWTPLFERYKVDAVFSGHDHVYSRAFRNGVHYFVSGGGGAPLYPKARNPSKIDLLATKFFERVNHYIRVHVVGDFVEVTSVRADGSLIETISWGTPPRQPAERLVAAVGAGQGAAPGSAAAAPGDAPQLLAAGNLATGGGGGVGLLGVLGVVVALLGGGVVFWSLRH